MAYVPPSVSPSDPIKRPIFRETPGVYGPTIDFTGIPNRPRTDDVVTLYENHLGWPPGPGSVLDEAIPTSGYPYLWTLLNAQGIKYNGIGLLVEYPGGVDGYFADYFNNNITFYVMLQLFPAEVIALPAADQEWWAPGWAARLVTSAPLAAIYAQAALYTGWLSIDIEAAWPFANDLMLNGDGGLYLMRYLQIYERNYGTVEDYQVVYDAYEQLAQEVWTKMIKQIRFVAKRARLVPYAMPYKGTAAVWAIPAQGGDPTGGAYGCVAADTRLGWFWALFDALGANGYQYYAVVADGTPGPYPDGTITYSQYIGYVGLYSDEVARLRSLFRMKAVWEIELVYDQAAGVAYGTGLTALGAECVAEQMNRASMDFPYIWDGDVSSSAIAAQRSIGAQNLQPYLNAFARTDP
jgi:hypothetical protein